MVENLLLLDANEHLAKEEALQLLPRHLVLAHPQSAVQPQLSESVTRVSKYFHWLLLYLAQLAVAGKMTAIPSSREVGRPLEA
jgi:hypothetical protein